MDNLVIYDDWFFYIYKGKLELKFNFLKLWYYFRRFVKKWKICKWIIVLF